jgi:hypothetical protein
MIQKTYATAWKITKDISNYKKIKPLLGKSKRILFEK